MGKNFLILRCVPKDKSFPRISLSETHAYHGDAQAPVAARRGGVLLVVVVVTAVASATKVSVVGVATGGVSSSSPSPLQSSTVVSAASFSIDADVCIIVPSTGKGSKSGGSLPVSTTYFPWENHNQVIWVLRLRCFFLIF